MREAERKRERASGDDDGRGRLRNRALDRLVGPINSRILQMNLKLFFRSELNVVCQNHN